MLASGDFHMLAATKPSPLVPHALCLAWGYGAEGQGGHGGSLHLRTPRGVSRLEGTPRGHGGSRASPLVVRPRLGHAVAFPGALWHCGEPITRGRRYVIAAFLWVASEAAVEAEALAASSLPEARR